MSWDSPDQRDDGDAQSCLPTAVQWCGAVCRCGVIKLVKNQSPSSLGNNPKPNPINPNHPSREEMKLVEYIIRIH